MTLGGQTLIVRSAVLTRVLQSHSRGGLVLAGDHQVTVDCGLVQVAEGSVLYTFIVKDDKYNKVVSRLSP